MLKDSRCIIEFCQNVMITQMSLRYHSRKSTGVNNNINDGWFNPAYNSSSLMFCMLPHLQGLLKHFNITESLSLLHVISRTVTCAFPYSTHNEVWIKNGASSEPSGCVHHTCFTNSKMQEVRCDEGSLLASSPTDKLPGLDWNRWHLGPERHTHSLLRSHKDRARHMNPNIFWWSSI